MENKFRFDKKAFVFYFLMSIIFVDFSNQVAKLSYNPYFLNTKNPIFSIVHLNNTGSAFSLFQNQSSFLIIFALCAIIFLSVYVIKKVKFKDKIELLALTMFNAGAIGNLAQRIEYGYVIDYIKLNFINFPVFNFSDILICGGVFLYILFVLFENPKKKEQNENQS